MGRKKVLIIGAGPAGLSCAYELAKNGCEVEVFEASPHVGGLCRTIGLWGQRVDLGPHRFFSNIPRVRDLWRRFSGEDRVSVRRLTRIYYGRKFFHYPLEPINLIRNLSIVEICRCLASFFRQRLRWRDQPIDSFEDWVTHRFGSRLFGIFFKTYTEKVWGIPCSRLDADWASQRIRSLSIKSLAADIFRLGAPGEKSPRTLVHEFEYPRLGAGTPYQNLAVECGRLGVKIHLSAPVARFFKDPQGRIGGVALQDGRKVFGTDVVSTMPLTLALKGLPEVPGRLLEAAEKLYFRNTILVYLEVAGPNCFPDNWVYVHSPEVRHGRVTNFRNWSPDLRGEANTSILCLEYWCYDRDPIWKAPDLDLKSLAERELRQIGLCRPENQIVNCQTIRLARSYPVYERGYREALNEIQDYFNSIPGLLAIGRNGSFKYNNQDHSIWMGLLAADEILGERKQNLWEVNSDQEYQESGPVSEKRAA